MNNFCKYVTYDKLNSSFRKRVKNIKDVITIKNFFNNSNYHLPTSVDDSTNSNQGESEVHQKILYILDRLEIDINDVEYKIPSNYGYGSFTIKTVNGYDVMKSILEYLTIYEEDHNYMYVY